MKQTTVTILHDELIPDDKVRDSIFITYSDGMIRYITRWRADEFLWQVQTGRGYCIFNLSHSPRFGKTKTKCTAEDLYQFITKNDPGSVQFMMFHPEIFDGKYEP